MGKAAVEAGAGTAPLHGQEKKSASQEALWVRGVDGVYMLLGSAVTICGKNHRITRASTIRKK